jgi:hypothetical protein
MTTFSKELCMNCRHHDEMNPYFLIPDWCYKKKERVSPLSSCEAWEPFMHTMVVLVNGYPMLYAGNSSRRAFNFG